MSEFQRFLAFLGATACLAAATVLVGPRLLGAASPEADIITAIKRSEVAGVATPVATGTLRSTALEYQRLSVQLASDGAEATVSGTLDFVGVLDRRSGGPATAVSALGLERQRWRHTEGAWHLVGRPLAQLAALVEALEALNPTDRAELDAGAPPSSGFAEAWYVRFERDGVVVTEDRRPSGASRGDEPVTRQRLLRQASDGGFEVSP